jgi:hypothetical protein
MTTKLTGKELKFWKKDRPARWFVSVDGHVLTDWRSSEADAFQDVLDKSGIGGKINYRPHPKKIGEWVFKYTPPKESDCACENCKKDREQLEKRRQAKAK